MTLRRQTCAVPRDARKRDTREKITLGGLVVKAGLREADRAFLLGVLLEAANLDPRNPRYAELKTIGRAAFAADVALPLRPAAVLPDAAAIIASA